MPSGPKAAVPPLWFDAAPCGISMVTRRYEGSVPSPLGARSSSTWMSPWLSV